MEIEQILEEYYSDNGKKIRALVNRILSKFGGVEDKDYDDFYSIANLVFADIMLKDRYDPSKGEFISFLYGCLSNKIKSEVNRRETVDKERSNTGAISIYSPITKDSSITIGDMIVSNFNIEENLNNFYQDEKVEKYLCSLSKRARNMIELKMQGYIPTEIKEKLCLTDRQYNKYWDQIRSFSNTHILFTNKENLRDELKGEIQMPRTISQTSEKSKQKQYSISSIIKKMNDYTIQFNHPTQRESDQWTPKMKSNLISDILQDNPIPALVFAEQIIDGSIIIWDLDGKQRCTNVYSFFNDGFKISRNIRRWNIVYQTKLKDELGNYIIGDNGVPKTEWAEFDIRGKRYSDLPEKLQEDFMDYIFEVTQYLNCSSEDIVYHISRYNEGKPMTPSQKGLAYLGEEYATLVKSISNMDFFKDRGDYKVSEFRNGTINRVVVESVMASHFIKDWKKQQEEMCGYIKDNATVSNFDDFEEMVERLTKVATEDVAEMFNSKDSFLWFGLFARFTNTGLDDEQYIEFMSEFDQSLHDINIDGVTFIELSGKSTKDKSVVIKKMNHLETLMNKYLDIKKNKL